jgi:hypothetical protein
MTWTPKEIAAMASELAEHFEAEARLWGAGGELSRVANRRDRERAGKAFFRLVMAVRRARDDDDR